MTRDQTEWNEDMVNLLLFMREIGATFNWITYVLQLEYPNNHFTEKSVSNKYRRMFK